ncbi:MAG: amino acid racemase [Actinomycetales bacterium]|nr:amino acid racemase [Actinomycetales bacterium]
MRRIGLIGGMSIESSMAYERVIVAEVRHRLGRDHSPRLVHWTLDWHEASTLLVAEDWDGLAEVLADAARRTEAAGAEIVLLCTNTMHRVADRIAAATSARFLPIAEAVAGAAVAAGVRRVGLLGTRFTMEQEFYRDALAANGLDVVVPGATDRDTVHAVIMDELVRGVVSPTSRQRYEGVVDRLVDQGVEGIVLGCTEIELLLDPDDPRWRLFPTTRLHAMAAVDAALAAS